MGVLPVGVELGVAFLTFLRPDIVSGDCGFLMLGGFLGRWLTEIADEEH